MEHCNEFVAVLFSHYLYHKFQLNSLSQNSRQLNSRMVRSLPEEVHFPSHDENTLKQLSSQWAECTEAISAWKGV